MSSVPIQIVTYMDRKPTDALLHLDLAPSVLAEVEKDWGPLRLGASRQIHQSGRTDEVPRHWHWDQEFHGGSNHLAPDHLWEQDRGTQGATTFPRRLDIPSPA